MTAPRRRTAGVAVWLLTAVALLGASPATASPVVAPSPSTAPADDRSAAEVRAEVDALRAEVERLEVAVDQAVEEYNTVRAQADALAAAEVDAQVRLDDAGRRLDADRSAATQRVRALYRVGGTTELTLTAVAVSIAAGDGPAAFAEQVRTFRTARTVLASDAEVVARARAQVDVAVSTSQAVQDVRRDRAAAETLAEERSAAAEALLREHQALLVTADQALVAAVERERQAEEARRLAEALAAAEARARAEAAAAAAAAPDAGGAGGLPSDPVARQSALVLAGESAGGPAPTSSSVAPGGRLPLDEARVVVERAAVAAPNPQAAAAIRAAGTKLGATYVWGATGPSTFDCSGLTMWSYRQAGVNIPRTSRQQYAGLRKVPVSQMVPGDLLFYASGSAPGSIHHVSMYLGDGLMITAPRTGDVVKVSALWSTPVYGAVRPVG
ncbi:NlpC/P60 family protein [Aquipuribacter nitratireducens]|uniref:NlpC/P60 family protein n=1 Tax=Aquipuribacter nitratireducens TaxID=650104 RepID=A0ABW0GPR7_9MICO